MQITYLDNNATTRPADEVVAAMLPFLTEWYGNPSSVHRFGQRSRQAVDEARHAVAQLIGAENSEILFTAGGTESVNTAIRSLLAGRKNNRTIVTTTVEHSATRALCDLLKQEGYEVVYIPVDAGGVLNEQALIDALANEPALFTSLYVNNETGVIFPVDRIAGLCREKRVPFHCDATQAVGKLSIDVKKLGIDAMSFAGHKIHGPKGTAALYMRRGIRIKPLIVGGPQERDRRGGTENVPGIVGLGKAAELALKAGEYEPRIRAMRDRLQATIQQTIGGTHVMGAEPRVANTLNIAFERLEAEAILILLSEQGICASAGAACSSGSLEPSPILRAMGIDDRIGHGAIRFSLSRYTTDAEIDHALAVLPGIITRLRAVLPI
jgi:cysteine desulfurase